MRVSEKMSRRLKLWNTQGGKCCLCGERMILAGEKTHPDYATFEHIKPLALGGAASAVSNIALAHRRCNMQRGRQDWFQRRPKRPEQTL